MPENEKSIGQEIGYTARCSRMFIDEYLSHNFPYDLTSAEGATLKSIFFAVGEEKEITARDIMERRKLNKATVSYSLKNLEQKGLITMKVKADDKRVKIILLTEEGKKMQEAFDKTFVKINAIQEKGLSEEEKTELRSLLKRYRENCGIKEDN